MTNVKFNDSELMTIKAGLASRMIELQKFKRAESTNPNERLIAETQIKDARMISVKIGDALSA